MSMSLKTDLCTLFDIKYPIILAGMAGISNMASLVAAVSNAGGLGTLGAAYMTPEEIQKIVREIKTLTPFPFSVNLFSTYAPDQYDRFKEVQQNLNKIRTMLGMDLSFDTEIKTPYFFKEQFQVVLEEQVPILSTTFGILPEEHMIQAKNKGIKIVTKITTVEEAKQAEQSGCDAIVAQGYEAGGHRGTFDISTRPMGAGIGTLALVPQVVDHINIPVIAAGGIMDGRGLVAALALGAQGIQMGTRFLTSAESGAHSVYKKALLKSTEESTVLTRAFSGRPARGILNRFITDWDENHNEPLPFPTQNTLTREIRSYSSRVANSDYMALWAGQGTRLLTDNERAIDIIQQMIEQAHKIIN